MKHKLNLDGVDGHPARYVYATVSAALTAAGIDVDLVKLLRAPGGRGITPELSEDVSSLIRSGVLPFTLDPDLSGYFGRSTGSANVTTLRLKRDLSLEDVIGQLADTGQLERAMDSLEMYLAPTDPTSDVVLAYALGQYAKGWLAEGVMTTWDDWSKGSVSQDEGGLDGYFRGEPAQLGSITRYNSKKKLLEASDTRQLLYQWGADGSLHLADLDEVLEMNKDLAKEAGLSATLLRRSHAQPAAARELGRPIRYLWW